MFKKILSVATALCMSCTIFSCAAFAAESFSDVISPDYDWAVQTINEMTAKGIIKGYTDNTFRPANSVKKIESLILLSRACGYSNSDYAPFIEYAEEYYSDVLDNFDFDTYGGYKSEVAFLLYKGVLKTDELENYLGNVSSPLKRYEAAILLTKLMGAEDQVKNNAAVVLDYSDYVDISASARAYVEYVTQQKLMNGVEDNCFAPNENVTRVQITILLSRILDALDYTTVVGTVENADSELGVVTLFNADENVSTAHIIPADVTVLKNAKAADLSDISSDSIGILVFSKDSLVSFEALSPESDEKDENGKDDENEPPVSEPVIETISGIVTDILDDSDGSGLTILDENNISHELAIDADSDVKITLDGKSVRLRKLSEGDSATVTLSDGQVSKIEAISREDSEPEVLPEKKLLSGTLSAIVISADSKIEISDEDISSVYSVSKSTLFTVDGKRATIYDLRLGTDVDVSVKNDVALTVDAVTPEPETMRMVGTVEDVDTDNGIITVIVNDNEEEIYVTSKTSIINSSTGKSVSISKLRQDQTVTAIGTFANDTFTAETIVVIP